jgi:hypothetical protein
MFAQSQNRVSLKSVGYFAPLQAATVQHLKQVYLSLAALVVAAAVGSYIELYNNVGGILTFIGTRQSPPARIFRDFESVTLQNLFVALFTQIIFLPPTRSETGTLTNFTLF